MAAVGPFAAVAPGNQKQKDSRANHHDDPSRFPFISLRHHRPRQLFADDLTLSGLGVSYISYRPLLDTHQSPTHDDPE